ncbi:hypothetical protein AX17_003251 [Amanita inopinata Kibby_2008]|nr:hypothetical protein AX17_003251 [Amanita inopinata Kibby_2008]
MPRRLFGKKSPEEKLAISRQSFSKSATIHRFQFFLISKRDSPGSHHIDHWNRGGIFDWYRETARISRTTIRKLELHKERDNFRHEFVVIYLEGGDIYRIDRRPLGGGNADTISSKGCEAEDSTLFVNKKELEADPANDRHGSYVGRPREEETGFMCVAQRPPMGLNVAMRTAVTTVLEGMLWPVVKADAETLIENANNLVGDSVNRAVVEWLLEATQATLWHDNLDNNLSAPQYMSTYETVTGDLLKETLKAELQTKLPHNMVTKLANIFPQRLLSKLPPSMLAKLSSESLGRVSVRVFEKLPDEFLARLPFDLLLKAPDDMLRRCPMHVYSKCTNHVLLNLPEDLSRIPDKLLDISLWRMQEVLERPEDSDRLLAIKLLQRLPNNVKERLPPEYRDMQDQIVGDQQLTQSTERVGETDGDMLALEHTATGTALSNRSRFSLSQVSILGLVMLATPRFILERFPPFTNDVVSCIMAEDAS